MPTEPNLVLASGSRTRQDMLSAAGLVVDVHPASVDESAVKQHLLSDGIAPDRLAAELAAAKALDVAARRPSDLVIGADQVLEFDGRPFDKPPTIEAARRQLMILRDAEHRLLSAVVVARGEAVLWRHVETARLRVRPFSDAFIDDYLARIGEAATRSVGGYQLEGPGVQLFDRVEGDFFTVLGLPLLPLLDFLREQGALAT